MTRYLIVAAGAALGGMTRYALSGAAQQALGAAFPYGTLSVNLLGCFLIGALMAGFEGRFAAAPEIRVFLVAGFLGGMTTFSAFAYETDALLRDGDSHRAFWNLIANVGLGLVAVVLGRAIAMALD